MQTNKKDRIQSFVCFFLVCTAMIYSVALMMSAGPEDNTDRPAVSKTGAYCLDYEDKLFDDSYVHRMDISMPDDQWADLKGTALKKNLHDCDLTIDGETFYHVGVRTKGNSTLLTSILSTSDKYSLFFDFTAFDPANTYHGLDCISTDNNSYDPSFMKEYLSLEMMRDMGVITPLVSQTQVFLNGEYLGLYTAFEGMGEAFAVRNYGTLHGQLYKPEMFDVSAMLNGTSVQKPRISLDTSKDISDQEIEKMLGLSDRISALQYVGDTLSDYDEIWVNSVFDISNTDKQRLIRTIKAVNEGDTDQRYVDREQLAKFFAVNTFLLNSDSYATNSVHNYYLYEAEGQISMIPWDYDVDMGSAYNAYDDPALYINTAVDTPVYGTTMEERPVLNALMNDSEWQEMYHNELRNIVDFCNEGRFEKKLNDMETMIRPYVEAENADMTRFGKAAENLRCFARERSTSIQKQLEGEIPSTTEEQFENIEMLENSEYDYFEAYDAMAVLTGGEKDIAVMVENLGSQLNVPVLLTMISDFDSLSSLSGDTSLEDQLTTLEEKGYTVDRQRLKVVVIKLVIRYASQVLMPVLSVITLITALICIRRANKKRQPRGLKKKTG